MFAFTCNSTQENENGEECFLPRNRHVSLRRSGRTFTSYCFPAGPCKLTAVTANKRLDLRFIIILLLIMKVGKYRTGVGVSSSRKAYRVEMIFISDVYSLL